jgi:hypothetical protein
MKILSTILAITLLAQLTAHADDRAARTPVVVELFTSEGCSSCPPADELLAKLVSEQPVERAQIIALAFHVDYWNKLGWPDRFSSREFTQRQYDYSASFAGHRVYTPQMIVDGSSEFVGNDSKKVHAAVRAAAAKPMLAVVISFTQEEPAQIKLQLSVPDSLRLSKNQTADLLVALTEDGLNSQVQRGENAGRTLHHAAVVRLLKSAATLSERADAKPVDVTFPLEKEWDRSKLKIVAFVQDRVSRRVLAAGAMDLSRAAQ